MLLLQRFDRCQRYHSIRLFIRPYDLTSVKYAKRLSIEFLLSSHIRRSIMVRSFISAMRVPELFTKKVCINIGYWFTHIHWKRYKFNGLDWSLLVKHLDYEYIHNSWLYCFTISLESETRVPISRGLVKQYNQGLCISS